MSRLCNTHPSTPALWECKQCNVAWCKECIETNTIQAYGIGSGQRAQYYCQSCSRPVRRVGRGKKKSSTWADIIACFSQPLKMQALIVMVPISIITAILASAGLNPLFFPVLWSALLPMSVIGLQKAAEGNFDSASLTKEELLCSIPEVLKHFVLFITVFTAFMQFLTRMGIFPAMMFICLAMAILPAIIAILLLSNRASNSLNPRIAFVTAQALGEAYSILAVFLPIFLIAMLWAGSWLGNVISLKIETLFFSLAVNYFTYVCYLLVGYIICHSQKELARITEFKEYYASDVEEEGIDAPRNECLHIVDQLIAENRVADALDYLENETTETVLDVQLAQRYYDLLQANNQGKRLLEHAKPYLDLLASENKEEELCSIYLDCQFEDPRFAPSPPTLFKIARLLNKRGQPREAVGAFYQFATVYRQSSYAPKALFLAATILNEQLNETEKAVSVLKDLVNSYPSYPMTREVRGYLKAAMKKQRRVQKKHDAPVYELRAVK